ncbi:MAG TPA: tRNA preQ1(34) S-adenosylmethionine ribosyltransferase-isomerase QueA [Planctomycetota bacterium]
MKASDFEYALPKELIAQEPLPRRDASRLLVLRRADGRIEHRAFPEVVDLLRGETLWLNETRVFPARLPLLRDTGGRVEALLLRRIAERRWLSLLDAGGRLRVGERLKVDDRSGVTLAAKDEDHWTLEFDAEPDLARLGQVPLPPYIRRAPDARDLERYQTVFARTEGSVAAPTAGLHFTPEILSRFDVRRLTLHVGVGTFKPVKAAEVEDHRMHAEWYEIPEPPAAPAVAVGTTTCRALESWAATGKTSGWTEIFIRPPHAFKAVKALITNFHLPKSTLLMLVCAFAGRERVLAAYEEAVKEKYRFFSYGDAMLIL